MAVIAQREDFNCSICFDVMESGVVTTPCNHHFHRECIVEWLKRDWSCPIDRGMLRMCDLVQNEVLPRAVAEWQRDTDRYVFPEARALLPPVEERWPEPRTSWINEEARVAEPVSSDWFGCDFLDLVCIIATIVCMVFDLYLEIL